MTRHNKARLQIAGFVVSASLGVVFLATSCAVALIQVLGTNPWLSQSDVWGWIVLGLVIITLGCFAMAAVFVDSGRK